MYCEYRFKKGNYNSERINQFLNKGLVLIHRNSKKNKKEINLFRDELELEFKNQGYPLQLDLNNLKNKNSKII